MDLAHVKKLKLPESSGSYQFYDKEGKIIYVGKAVNLKSRVESYWQESTDHSPAKKKMVGQVVKIKWLVTDSEIEALLLEANLIKKHQPYYNVLLRDDKRFIYIKVTTEAEIPSVMATRKIDKTGKYFGPFISTTAVRETLKALRKIWPYCTAKTKQVKPCFYYQIGRCLGICANKISRQEYEAKVIKPLIAFLSGKKNQVIRDLKKQSKFLRDHDKLSEAEKINYQIKNITTVLANAKIISSADKFASDVVELAKILSLPAIPRRIEGYDISNIFNKSAVGSMVVFDDGEPNKNEYRKFKIKQTELNTKQGDVWMLKEMIERRFNNDWPLPDLIVVDGGKQQLNIILKILKDRKLKIMALGIIKGGGLRSSIAPDKLYFPGEKKPLELALSSPALHLIKRIRDEAHRFAITYHRNLRSKQLFK